MHLEHDPSQNPPYILEFDIAESEIIREAFEARVGELILTGLGDTITENDVDLAHWNKNDGPIKVAINHPRRITEVLYRFCLNILSEHCSVFENFDSNTEIKPEDETIIPLTESVQKALGALEVVEKIKLETTVTRLVAKLDEGLTNYFN